MPATSPPGDERSQHGARLPSADRTPFSPRMPVYLTPFIGRQLEVAQATELLERDDVRLLTLTGPGGIGKTRLALRLATELAPRFSSGVCFVSLSSVTQPDMVLPAIARAIDIPDTGNRPLPDTLKTALRDRRLLLILDNFEQVVHAATEVTDLLAHCPSLKVIVTSRVVLRVQGEQEFPVPPLATPARGPGRTWNVAPLDELNSYDAITLFVQRARSVQPSFTLNDDNALAVAEICTRLDGLPLAIELAAARIKVLTPPLLLTRLTNRLHVLTGGARDQPERLRTMRDAIAWSYDLLDPPEQHLFQVLSVFANGFTLDAAESVLSGAQMPIDVLDGVAALVDSSLLREYEQPDGDHRFRMLTTIREYGLEQLSDSQLEETARRRHAQWCAALAKRAEPEYGRADVISWLDRLEREHDNVRAALSWLLAQGEAEQCMQLVLSFWMFWFYRSYFKEARMWIERVLAQLPRTSTLLRAHALRIAGLFAESLGDFATATEYLDESLRIATELDDPETSAMAHLVLGDIFDNQGDDDRAEPLLWRAVELFRELGEHMWQVTTLAFLGILLLRRGENDVAESLVNEALELSRERGFIWGTAICLNRLGRVASQRGGLTRAADLHVESLMIWRDLGDYWRMTRVLIDLADVASASGEHERAARLLGAAEGLTEPLGISESFTDVSVRRRALESTQRAIDEETFARAWALGRAMSWDEAIAEAIVARTDASSSSPVAPSPLEPDNDRHGLTAREMEVLQLIVAGHTDRQIADELFISRRTAQGHVSSIFNKLGVSSRTAAATAAIRDGLVTPEQTVS